MGYAGAFQSVLGRGVVPTMSVSSHCTYTAFGLVLEAVKTLLQPHHSPYLIEQANCSEWTIEPIRENGFPSPCGNPVSVLVAEPVDVNIYPLE